MFGFAGGEQRYLAFGEGMQRCLFDGEMRFNIMLMWHMS